MLCVLGSELLGYGKTLWWNHREKELKDGVEMEGGREGGEGGREGRGVEIKVREENRKVVK